MENYIKLIKKELELSLDEENIIKFTDIITAECSRDQIEGFAKLSGYILEELEEKSVESLLEVIKGVDTFDNPLEFIKYFYKFTNPELLDSILERIEEDSEELEYLLDSMENSNLISYLVDFDGFYVWYKG